MQVQVEDVGPCKKLVKIDIPPEKVDEELEKAYEQLNESVTVPGFRRGHVPRWLMKSKFGKQINEDTRDTLMAESLDEAVKENELRPMGEPKFDEDIKLSPGEPLSFGVTMEVRPEFDIDDYTELKLKKPSSAPTKAEVEERTEAIRKRYAKLEELTEGAPQPEDVVLCHVSLSEGEEVYQDVPDHQFIVGDHVLVGMTLEETVAFVTGATIGEPREQEVTLPEEFPDEKKRGAKMTLALELTKIRRPVLPELTEDWAKEMGFDSLEELDDEVKAALAREKETVARSELEDQMNEQLVRKVDFELPADIINQMAERSVVRQSLALRYRGVPMEEVKAQLDKLRAESKESAARAAKLYFILDRIADKERLFVTEEDVNARVEAMAANDQRSSDQVKRELESDNRLSELRTSMREEKVRSFLLEKAVVKEAKGSPKKGAKSEE